MTSKERIQAALAGETVDYVPFCPFLAYVWETFPQDVVDAGQLEFHHRIGADPLWRGAACPVKSIGPEELRTQSFEEGDRTVTVIETPVGSLRFAGMLSAAGNTSFLVEHPLKTAEDFKVQTWIEENTKIVYDPQPMREHFSGVGREGMSLGMLIPRAKSAYQALVEHHAGTEELIYALMDFPDAVETLWKTMVEKDLEAVKMAVESEYEYFITWEDSSTQNYSPAQYDQYIGAEIGQWCRILNDAGKHYVQHACGHVAALVERMAEHGAHSIESISPPPTGNISIAETRAKVGDRLGIIGGIEPTQFLNLSMDRLTEYVESVLADGVGGPFVLANSDSCPPGVTLEKFKLVADIARSRTL